MNLNALKIGLTLAAAASMSFGDAIITSGDVALGGDFDDSLDDSAPAARAQGPASARGSLGSPRTISPMMLRWICDVPA